MTSYLTLLGMKSCITICDLENSAGIKKIDIRYEILNRFKRLKKFHWYKKNGMKSCIRIFDS